MTSADLTDTLRVTLDDGVLTVTFDRPRVRNALTFPMYQRLREACEQADADADVMVLTGAGGSFSAGTDITEFAGFDGDLGVAYETMVGDIVDRVEAVRVPTVAAVSGACMGGGLILAAACDLRIADTTARFGIPIARTIGNAVSSNSLSFLVLHLGRSRTLNLLLGARDLTADDALVAGFVAACVAPHDLEQTVADVVAELRSHAPLTMHAVKELTRRSRRQLITEDQDVLAAVYGSADFAAGVAGRINRVAPEWTGK